MKAPKCPSCGEQLLISIEEGEKPVRCSECEAQFSVAELRQISEKLLQLCTWIESAPFRT